MQSTSEMTPTENLIESAKRQRRWLRWSCRVGIVFAAVAILFATSRPLYVRWQLRQHGWRLATYPSGLPRWIPKWAAVWFDRINIAHLGPSPLQLSDLESLRRFPNLQMMTFGSTDVSEAALETMSQFPELQSLSFSTARLETAGLRHLATQRKLVHLTFFDVSLDASALEHVAACRQLTHLRLTGISDDDAHYLSRLCRLKFLGLFKCDLTDEGLKRLTEGCLDLETLTIAGAKVTDDGLAESARFRHLQDLYLHDMPITDNGVLKLNACGTLKLLSIKNTKVTSAGVTELRKSLPTLKVSIE